MPRRKLDPVEAGRVEGMRVAESIALQFLLAKYFESQTDPRASRLATLKALQDALGSVERGSGMEPEFLRGVREGCTDHLRMLIDADDSIRKAH